MALVLDSYKIYGTQETPKTIFISNGVLRSMYVILAGVVATDLWTVFNRLDQLIFFYPIWIFYLPEDAITGFILTKITSILL
jgi:hypothetical protein